MLILVFMKMAADLALYYTFAGFFAALFGASSEVMLLVLAVQTAVFTLSYVMRKFGRWRFLPLALLVLCWFMPGAGLADYIIIAPPALYMVYLSFKDIYEPDWSQQKEIFSVFWKAFLAFSALCILLGKAEQVRSIVLPAGLVMLMCSVLLMRSLRHEPEVYCQVKYQAVNVLLICAACACALFLSSDVFLGAFLEILKTLYGWVAGLLLTVLFYVITMIVKVVAWLAALFKFKGFTLETEEVNIDVPDFREMLGLEEQTTSGGEWFDRIVVVIGILAAAAIVILIFRALAKRGGSHRSECKAGEARTNLSQKGARPDDAPAGSPVARVRAQYKRFLKLAASQNLEPLKSDTSLDISKRCREMFDDKSVGELRDIYIEARYDGKATREDVQRAKQLYAEIKKSSDR